MPKALRMIKSFIAHVHGRVQGVGFRYSALRQAKSLRLMGWVRNEPDGSVTSRFQGPESDVKQYISWLKVGPSSSVVRECVLNELSVDESLKSFHISF